MSLFILYPTTGTYLNDGWEGVLSDTAPVLWISCLTALAASGIPDNAG